MVAPIRGKRMSGIGKLRSIRYLPQLVCWVHRMGKVYSVLITRRWREPDATDQLAKAG